MKTTYTCKRCGKVWTDNNPGLDVLGIPDETTEIDFCYDCSTPKEWPGKEVMVNGHLVAFGAAVNLMDDEIREDLHADGITDKQEFIGEYCKRHLEKYGEEFQVN